MLTMPTRMLPTSHHSRFHSSECMVSWCAGFFVALVSCSLSSSPPLAISPSLPPKPSPFLHLSLSDSLPPSIAPSLPLPLSTSLPLCLAPYPPLSIFPSLPLSYSGG
ncbi:unnamed protein product [Closterium sp. Yama58-4]|nr:unnamed protein product [Closterium sp. Yama58-4]